MSAALFIWCLPWFPLAAQTFNFDEEWRWTHFTTESGLPSNNVIEIIEDHNGIIWARSVTGLTWFDGYKWNTIDSIGGTPITEAFGIKEGIDDSILVRFPDHNYSGNNLGFRLLQNIPSVHFITTLNDKYYYHDKEWGFYVSDQGKNSLIKKNVTHLFHSRYPHIWYTADSGLYLYDGIKTEERFSIKDNLLLVSALAENTSGSGLLHLNRPATISGIWEWHKNGKPIRNETEQGSISTLDINSNGDIICIYQSGEVRVRENGIWRSPNYIPFQLKYCKVVLFSSNGDLWLANERGVYLFRTSNSRWKFFNIPTPDISNNINDVLQLKDGSIWLATGGGVTILEPNGTMKHINTILGTRLFGITGLASDNQGNIWISSGSSFQGAFRWDKKEWRHFEIGDTPSVTMIHKIIPDKRGNLWFLGLGKYGTVNVNEPGAFLYNGETFIPWTNQHQLLNKRIYSFAEGKDGCYWFGTVGGIYQWKPSPANSDSGTWKLWKARDKLLWPRIFTIAIDSQNTVWFGHGLLDNDLGLGRITPSGSIEYSTTNEGLAENHVNDISVDSAGTIWVTTNKGLSSLSKGTWTTYNEKSGLICPQLWPVKAYSNYVLVGTLGKGLGVLTKSNSIERPPIVTLSSPLVETDNVLLRWETYAYYGEIPQQEIFTRYSINNGNWSAWDNKRSLSLNELSPGNYVFRIQARGKYSQFSENGSMVSFVILPPLWARPIFYIPIGLAVISFISIIVSSFIRKRAADTELRKSEEKFRTVTQTTPSAIFIYGEGTILYANPAALVLTEYSFDELLTMKFDTLLHPRFQAPVAPVNTITSDHATPVQEIKIITKSNEERWIELTTNPLLFQGNNAMLAVAFDVTHRKESELQLRALTFELSRTEERERRRLAAYLHDTIGQNLAFLKLKMRTLIKRTSSLENEKTTREINDIVENLIQDSQTLTFELSLPVLNELGLEAALAWLAERINERHNIRCHINFDISAKLLPYELETMLFNSIKELTTNVVKHSGATSMSIAIRYVDKKISVSVSDNGKGFDFADAAPSINKKGGFGLFNIRQRITSLGGTLEVTTGPNGGTTITIVLPLLQDESRYE